VKRLAVILLPAMVIMACEGKQGPMGPQGPQGPSGAPILYYNGHISAQDYDPYGYVQIEHYLIEEQDVIQVYLSPDPDYYTWMFMPLYEITDGTIYLYDPDHTFEGWEYMVMIIKNSEG
jgi:hypothetical protein